MCVCVCLYLHRLPCDKYFIDLSALDRNNVAIAVYKIIDYFVHLCLCFCSGPHCSSFGAYISSWWWVLWFIGEYSQNAVLMQLQIHKFKLWHLCLQWGFTILHTETAHMTSVVTSHWWSCNPQAQPNSVICSTVYYNLIYYTYTRSFGHGLYYLLKNYLPKFLRSEIYETSLTDPNPVGTKTLARLSEILNWKLAQPKCGLNLFELQKHTVYLWTAF